MSVTIKRQKGETDSQLIAKFRRQTQEIVDEAKERQFHETESEKKKKRLKYLRSKGWRK